MASRFGPRAGGTDGSDFSHRETVASHYKDSVLFKNRLLKVIYAHFVLVVVVSCYLALVTDRPWWLFSWMATALTCVLGFLAVPKNHSGLLTMFALNSLIVGMGSAGFGLYAYLSSHSGSLLVPAGCLIAILIHTIELAYSRALISSWKAKRRRA